MIAQVIPLRTAAPAPTAPLAPVPMHPTDRFLRLPTVRDRVGLSTATIYRYIDAGLFPRQVPLGARAVAWRESQINAYIAGEWVAQGGAA